MSEAGPITLLPGQVFQFATSTLELGMNYAKKFAEDPEALDFGVGYHEDGLVGGLAGGSQDFLQ